MEEHRNPYAFPALTESDEYNGMTLRDWFAGQALGALLSGEDARRMNHKVASGTGQPTVHFVSGLAYEYADAMLTARREQADG
jgi:hypothetical protein